MKKRRRALETDTAGFVMKLRRLRKQVLCRSCPKAYPSADVRVWFHRKLTCYPVCVYGFTKSLPVTRSCVLYGFDVPFHLFNRTYHHTGFISEQFRRSGTFCKQSFSEPGRIRTELLIKRLLVFS
ncbi:hypothetical protein [Bacteroides pyogenes]|uniref:hypothetical protein n=1 Tax=Bacteroides pyogenes TaxID=310300 RepID=UPI001BAC817F|nr:hypothetical protein [Bacteroides pyogenes]